MPQRPLKNTISFEAKQREAILESLRKGSTRSAAARAANIDRKTFYRWLKADSQFADDVSDAEAECIESVEGLAYECAMRAKTDVRYLSALIFYLKCRAKWNERAGEGTSRVLPGDNPRTEITGELAFTDDEDRATA